MISNQVKQIIPSSDEKNIWNDKKQIKKCFVLVQTSGSDSFFFIRENCYFFSCLQMVLGAKPIRYFFQKIKSRLKF